MKRQHPLTQAERQTALEIVDRLTRDHAGREVCVARAVQRIMESSARLAETVERARLQRVACDEIVRDVCAYFGLRESELRESMVHRTSGARKIAWALMVRRAGCSYAEIARMFGRSHTSVRQGVESANILSAEYLALANQVEAAE